MNNLVIVGVTKSSAVKLETSDRAVKLRQTFQDLDILCKRTILFLRLNKNGGSGCATGLATVHLKNAHIFYMFACLAGAGLRREAENEEGEKVTKHFELDCEKNKLNSLKKRKEKGISTCNHILQLC